MQKGGVKGIFKNAITKVKECHLTRFQNNYNNILDDEIDFDNEKLGDSKLEIQQTKMRSAIIQNEKKITPYQSNSLKDNKLGKINIVKNKKLVTKIIGEKKIILKRGSSSVNKKVVPNSHKILNKSDNFTWKHDLFDDLPNKNYKVFIRNLPNSVAQSELNDIFSEYGNISGINV